MKTVTRLPGSLGWIVFWCALTGSASLIVAAADPSPVLRAVFGAMSALNFIAALGLVRLQPWGRALGAASLFIGAAIRGLALLASFKAGTLVWLAVNLYWAVYLCLPSTKRMFLRSAGGRIPWRSVAVRVLVLLPFPILVILMLQWKLPKAVTIGVPLGLLALYVVFADARMTSWAARFLARRPDDLDPAAWEAVRRAIDRRRRGDLDGATRLLPEGDGLTLRVLRGLVAMDRAKTAETLDRALLDASWIAPVAARETLLREVRQPDLRERIEARARLVDGLLEDDARRHSLFSEEVDAALQRVTGQFFMSNEVFQHREAWEKRRPLCTGDRALLWMTIRLWDAQAPEAAIHVAGLLRDPQIEEIARLSFRLDQASRGLFNEQWMAENSLNLCLLPVPSDAARLLFLDSPYMSMLGTEAVASRLSARLELVSRLRRLRDEYPAESWIEVPWLIAQLTGHGADLRTRPKFERWWESARGTQLTFDGSFVAGLDAARREDWRRAEEQFAEAEKAWPERTCAVYNRSLMLMSLDRPAEAEAIFARLAKSEPHEAVFWMRTGDARRLQNQIAKAIEAYRQAAKLGGLEGEVAMRLGLTLAADGREDEAERELDRAAQAGEADADQLDDLATYLEAEGVYRLASRYREQAFLKRLGEKPTREDGDPGGDGLGV